ncbi:hypothetical protein DL95DRAFT_171862 [Leptodontidium sp. 2 PMI_412]|nr:hypothetical protein DL95DRAFT_171862 [Leptodontidium sp. 2 PMI_412]
MTGKFSDKDHQRCIHYARFFQNLTLSEVNSIFWLLFIFVRPSSHPSPFLSEQC